MSLHTGSQLNFRFEKPINQDDFDYPVRVKPELEACPFCGGEPELRAWRTWDKESNWRWSIRCIDCKVSTRSKAGPEAKVYLKEFWNSRR